MSSVIPSQNLRRELRWSQSRIRHHTLQSPTEDHQLQVLNPACTRREARPGPTQGATRASRSDDIDDVVMRGDDADENRAEHPSSSGSDSRRRITTKREPREVGDAQTNVTEQHVPGRILKNTTLSEHPVAGYHTRGTGRVPRENNEGRERGGEQHIDFGVNFISRSTGHDAFRFHREVST